MSTSIAHTTPRPNLASRWRFALKLASAPKLLVPWLVGLSLVDGRVDVGNAFLSLLFVLSGLAFIVLLNDVFDADVDRIKRAMFPHTSKKTLPDKILSSGVLTAGGILAAVLAAGSLCAIAWRQQVLTPLIVGINGMLIFVAYSLPPIKLNYRGGGEFLEMLGVGLALPLITAVSAGGTDKLTLAPFFLLGFCLLSLASAIASGISDEESDRAGGKRTFVTRYGNERGRHLIYMLLIAVALIFFVMSPLEEGLITGFLVLLVTIYLVQRRSAAATTNRFSAQKHYKNALHYGIWCTAVVISVWRMVVIHGWIGA